MSSGAKTGTAETTVDGELSKPLCQCGWLMLKQSKIAVAVVFPHNTNLQATVSHSITRDIINITIRNTP